MILTVKERGQFVATMRFIHVWLMETLAGWVPTTPEMEVKILFGEHIWDIAQHADALGKRTSELRMPLQHSLEPVTEYLDMLNDFANLSTTEEKFSMLYDIMLPAISTRYRTYLEETDSLADAPTVRILERHIFDTNRMLDSSKQVASELSSLPTVESHWINAQIKRETALENILPIDLVFET